MGRLAGKTALVTGASQGIGRGIALALAKEGAAVAVAARTAAKLDGVAREIEAAGASALAVPCDVADRAAVLSMVDDVASTFGGLDVLVNNAQGIPPNRRLQDVLVEDSELAWSTGPMATLHCMQAAFPHMSKNGGSIVNFGSNTAVEGSPLFGAYAMAKEGIRGLSKVAAREWGRFGIRVNVVCPFADSPAALTFNEARPDAAAAVLKATPLGRMGDCEDDIGRAVVALVSPDLSYVTGATLMVDGGLCMLR
ncbi:SDR family NAD(P)-dependent oxidoreductase [Actinomadura sp. LOL_016]|uniref:SDR family NAD(P)-dependent oxidoreductase n=1 Tax=unclassified Actinomadura TaxID=2626254 RepID=UPI003A80ACBB